MVRVGRAVRASRLGVSRAVRVSHAVRASWLGVSQAVRVIRAVKVGRLAARVNMLDSCVTSNFGRS